MEYADLYFDVAITYRDVQRWRDALDLCTAIQVHPQVRCRCRFHLCVGCR